ncbi:hypothetical protein HY090_02010 [Candidatus Kaiserbacteria bacterium]|nr:hypothetical protein [Candidatus Kaiserbacteria bacterium]
MNFIPQRFQKAIFFLVLAAFFFVGVFGFTTVGMAKKNLNVYRFRINDSGKELLASRFKKRFQTVFLIRNFFKPSDMSRAITLAGFLLLISSRYGT